MFFCHQLATSQKAHGREEPSFRTTSVRAELHQSTNGSSTKNIELVAVEASGTYKTYYLFTREAQSPWERKMCKQVFQCSKTGAVIKVQRRCYRDTDGGSIASAWESLGKYQSAGEFRFLEGETDFTKKKDLSKEAHQLWRQKSGMYLVFSVCKRRTSSLPISLCVKR